MTSKSTNAGKKQQEKNEKPSHQNKLVEAEEIAEEILSDKQQIVDFDKRRNVNREALRSLKDSKDNKTWLCSGADLFIKLPTDGARKIIEKDQRTLDEEINKLRDQLKVKTSKLSEIEGTEDSTKPFFLKPTSVSSLSSMTGTKRTETYVDMET